MVFFVGIGLIGYIVRLFNRLVSVRFPFCVLWLGEFVGLLVGLVVVGCLGGELLLLGFTSF